MKRLLTTLSEKWPEYLIEAIVIIASILGAYALDNWNENRTSKSKQKIYIKHIQSNLQDDKLQLEQLLVIATDIRDRTETLIENYKTGQLDIELATGSAGIIALEKNFNGNRSGIDALLNSGHLDLLPTELGLGLQQYYELSENIIKRESMSNSFITDFYEPHFFDSYSECFTQIDGYNIREIYQGDSRPASLINAEKFLMDRKLEAHIVIRYVHSKLEVELYESQIKMSDSLQNVIQNYLLNP